DIVERSNNMRLSGGLHHYFALFRCFGTCLCHCAYVLFGCLLLVGNCFSFSFSGPGVVLGTLAPQWQSRSVANTAVTTDIHQTFDVHLGLRAKFPLNGIAGNGVPDPSDLVVVPIGYLRILVYLSGL